MGILRIRPFVPYEEAFDEFTKIRKELNDKIDEKEEFLELFNQVKIAAAHENTVAMDILAYYYKSGVKDVLPENYQRYIQWEMIAAGRGNEFAIEKLQFLIGYACDEIMEDEDFDLIAYKNDIDEGNLLYVLGKAVAKMLVRELEYFPVDLYEKEDEYLPYKQEYSVILRQNIDKIIPKVIEFLKS